MNTLLPVDEARERLLSLAAQCDEETLAIGNADGRWLARPVRARRSQPPADLSAMDGYAIRFADMPGPWRVIGESAAGRPVGKTVGQKETVRIFTGAQMPEGADTVLVQEDADSDGAQVRLTGEGPGQPGRHVRTLGGDFSKGDAILPAGSLLNSRRIGLMISAGHDDAVVRQRPKLALISTGDELALPGKAVDDPAVIPASNGPALIAQLAHLPVQISDHGIVADDLEALAKVLERARKADIIVTIGGASVGDHDLVQKALRAAGARIDFWRIAMKPGKPLMAGTLGKAVVLGLPGNPASAYVTAKLFLEPLIAKMGGAADPGPAFVRAMLATSLPAAGDREEYLRGHWTDGGVSPLDGQQSSLIRALAEAELLIRRPAAASEARPGDHIEILGLT